MAKVFPLQARMALWVSVVACLAGPGCQSCETVVEAPNGLPPVELNKVMLPDYVIEPPDILVIDAIRVVPRPPYRIEPLDVLLISVPNTLPSTEVIAGPYQVDTEGNVTLGEYAVVPVVGLTIPEATEAIRRRLEKRIKQPQVTVVLGQSRALQVIRGPHLVRPDGTIGLGTYGKVPVTGLTIAEARTAIQAHLSQYLLNPEISLDVAAYNSKVYYVIFDGGGAGQQIVRLPVTGNETVLDAIAEVKGLTPVADKHHVWVARPAPRSSGCDQVLPVDWVGITTKGRTETNYQLMPGDRVYVKADPWVTGDTKLARILSPFERVFGFTLLGSGTVFTIEANTAGGKFMKGSGTTTGIGGF
jgi:polysaccharide export outer membrane protein